MIAGAVICVLVAGCETPEPTSEAPPVIRSFLFEPGAEPDRALARGEVHRVPIVLEAGEYLHLAVQQRGVDLAIHLFDPGGRKLAEVDSPNGTRGEEHLWFLADDAGEYRLDLHPSAGAGSYVLRHLAQRRATAEDMDRVKAARALADGERLRLAGGREGWREALVRYGEALAIWRRLGDPAQEAVTLVRIGQIWGELGDREAQIRSYEQALKALRGLGLATQEIYVLLRLGTARDHEVEPSAALGAFEEALRLAREIEERFEEATALNNMALLFEREGRMQQALRLFREVLSIYRQAGRRHWAAIVLSNIGSSYILIGQLQEARENLEEALELFRDVGDKQHMTRALIHLGWIDYLEGDYSGALARYSRAIELSRAADLREDEASALDRQGTAYLQLGKIGKALASYRRARELFLNHPISIAHVEANLGWLHLRQGNAERAWDFFETSLERFRQAHERHGEAYTLYLGARIERQRGRLPEALGYIEQVLDIIESHRRLSTDPVVRMAYLESRYDYYEFEIDLLMELDAEHPAAGYAEQAVAAVERSRARSLLDQLVEAEADIRRDVEEELLEQARELGAQLNARQLERLENPSPENERALAEILEAYRRVQAEIRETSPAAALAQARTLDLNEIQRQLLDETTLLLVYSLGRERSFVWAITASSMTAHALGPADEIEALATDLYSSLRRSRARPHRMQARLRATALSEKILRPVAGELGRRRLIVMADGALHLIPFAMLPKPSDAGEEIPLIVEHEILHVPSASVVAMLRREALGRPATRGVAVVADPVFTPPDPRVTSGNAPAETVGTAGFFYLERLVHSRLEAEAIRNLVPEGVPYLEALDFAARRELVTSGELRGYRILHFATHGLLDAEHPELTGIALSMVTADGREVDGVLRAHEIYQLDLPAELVVLSACRTALGQRFRGEGVLGLSRAFMYAGTPRVLVSLWSLSDQGTAELMRRFYAGVLGRGMDPAAALREAQMSMLAEERWRVPYYWAAFVLQGDWR